MFENSTNDFYLPSSHDEELVDNLCSEESEDGGSLSLEKALLPLVEGSLPGVSSWVCSTRYKTELCTGYSTAGFCKYAERCQFAHGLHELHVPFRHPKYKTEFCRSYHATGYCYYGSRCLFVHNPAEQRRALRRRNIPCRTFGSFGICPFGSHCNFLHDERKDGGNGGVDLTDCERTPSCSQSQMQSKKWKPRGSLCHTFNSFGFCLYGTRCRFQHGLPSKIQSPGGYASPQLSPCSSGLGSTFSNVSTSSPTSPLEPSSTVSNAFPSSSQDLSNLLPLAFHLQQLERQLERTNSLGLWENLL
ncbi:cysteine three histidine 1 [Cololabis saira]|uniref:cysteine three histidine 1 n=1 Tax=Cololabis saira TaxID=129043 RepID=UPI002AD55D13|nr:cysteine three histidine 1 [Cololabis saira]